MRSSITTLIALAASVSAIQITWPNITDVNGTPSIDLSVAQTITWTSDPSDPTTITKIALVVPPMNGSTTGLPTSEIDIASSIQTSLNQYIMQPPSGLTVNGTYQIWFYGPYNSTTTGEIAASPFFKAGKISTTASPTTTGGSGSGSGGSGGSGATATGSAATTSSTKKANAAGTLKAFAGAGLLSGVAMLFL